NGQLGAGHDLDGGGAGQGDRAAPEVVVDRHGQSGVAEGGVAGAVEGELLVPDPQAGGDAAVEPPDGALQLHSGAVALHEGGDGHEGPRGRRRNQLLLVVADERAAEVDHEDVAGVGHGDRAAHVEDAGEFVQLRLHDGRAVGGEDRGGGVAVEGQRVAAG